MNPTEKQYGDTVHQITHRVHEAASGGLPFTGSDLVILVIAALALLIAGIALHRHYRIS